MILLIVALAWAHIADRAYQRGDYVRMREYGPPALRLGALAKWESIAEFMVVMVITVARR